MQAILFDLDGTLVDSLEDLRTALNVTLAGDGRPPLALEQVRPLVGDGARALVQRAYGHTGGVPAEAEMKLRLERFLAAYDGCLLEHTRPYDGIPEVLASLQGGGARLAVCTNKPGGASRRILEGLDLAGRFDVVIGGDDLPWKKPDARHLLVALERLGAPVEGSILVGDGPADILAGRAAKVRTVAVSWGYTPAAALGADAIVATPADLLGYLQPP